MWYFKQWIMPLLLLQCFHCQEHIHEEADSDILEQNILDETRTMDEEYYELDPSTEQLYLLLNTMYSTISHGDSRYFDMLIQELSNDTFSDILLDETIMEAIESTFVHILNTMHLISEISIKINANAMQINAMNDGLLLILKSTIKFLKISKLNTFISDTTYSAQYPVSFVNVLLCEGISLSLQFRLINTLKYLLIPSVMNNTEQYYCFDTYHNVINQSYFHIAAKSRSSGFVRLFFHLPTSLPVMKHLHINNKGLMKRINKKNPIINEEMVKKRVSDIDVLIILRHAFQLNLPNEWYLRKDINHNSAFDLWIKRAPHYLRFVYYHSVISKLFSSHHQHISVDNATCVSMQYVAKYWPTIQWFPIPVDGKEESITEVYDETAFDDIFETKWLQQQPLIFRNGIYEKWNLSQLQLVELSDIMVDDVFVTSDIPYQDLYENEDIDTEREDDTVTFTDFTHKYFDELQSANMEVMCKELKNKRRKQTDKGLDMDVSYIFDNNVYWKNMKFAERFNVTQLIPKYIYHLMQGMIDDYDSKFEVNFGNETEEKIAFNINDVVESIVMLKQLAVGGIFSGAQPHFHGPVFNALLMGEKQWIIFPPKKAFQMKQSAVQFFCYHENLSKEKKEKLTFYTFTQNPGDVVFIPSEWGHAVLNVQPSIGVAVEMFI